MSGVHKRYCVRIMFRRTLALQLVFYVLLFTGTIVVDAFASPRVVAQQRFPSTTKLPTATGTIDDDIFVTQEEPQLASQEQFNWQKTWYPLVPVEILDREKPHRFELLGQSIVVWNDGPVIGAGKFRSKKQRPRGAKRSEEGKWRAFADECPHRKVPLSEGRVEDDGTLLCSYHAWRFNGEGTCVAVPSIESEETLQRVVSSPKSFCNTFPTKVINGVLFIWPSSDPEAILESELTPVTHRASLVKNNNSNNNNRVWEGPWNFRELPYGADFFIENVVDPAHVAVSHHNLIGDRYRKQYMDMKTKVPLTKNGFSFTGKKYGRPQTDYNFYAPSLVANDFPIGTDGAKQSFELYVAPSRPGFSYHIGRIVVTRDKHGKFPPLTPRLAGLPVPIWLFHILSSLAISQDALFLHHQERSMALNEQYASLLKDGQDAYDYGTAVLPVNTDLGVMLYRNWIRKLAGGRIPYKNNPIMPPPSNDVVFDVWNGHTKHCRYCQDALRRLKRVRLVSLAAAACLAIVRPFGKTGTLFSSLGLAAFGMAVNKLIGMFYRFEFSHARND